MLKRNRMHKIKTGIVGAAGYTGGELLRLLLNHPQTEIIFAASRSHNGEKISSVHHDLIGETEMVFLDSNIDVDVVFLCLPHKQSRTWMDSNHFPEHVKVIDLGNDFRIDNRMGKHNFVYGLPELFREKIRKATHVANPGCFATAIQLALLPVVQHIPPTGANVTGITGSTGAGSELTRSTSFSWRSSNVSAYKTLVHQHNEEVAATFRIVSGNDITVTFIPWRGSFTRGIFISAIIDTHLQKEELFKMYEDFYYDHPFTFVTSQPIDLKQVVNTNKCLIQLEKVNSKLVIHAVIDNLLKGASGQAVQNMNLMFGLDERTGLQLKSSVY